MFLLDTNVISELRAGKPQQSPAVRAWATSVPANQLYLASVSVLELEMGVLRMTRKDARQGNILRIWVEAVLRQFQDQVLPFSAETAMLCAPMHVPDVRSFRDSMIAATALQHGLTLVTRNTVDFESTGIKLINPWDHGSASTSQSIQEPQAVYGIHALLSRGAVVTNEQIDKLRDDQGV